MQADLRIHSEEYVRHLHSEMWQKMRRAKLKETGGHCERCGCSELTGERLEIHHLTYERLGNERREDLKVVCQACHVVEDGKRAEHTERRNWDARVAGDAARRWGNDWNLYHEWWEAEEALEEWIERIDEA